jgi:proline iminopeptidase
MIHRRLLSLPVAIPLLLLTAGTAVAQTDTEKFPNQEGYLTAADSVRLFYRKLGKEKDFVVFLHGGPGLSMGDGGYAMRPLAERHTLILYDQ